MKVALVHDFIKEHGGAERVLRVLADLYPKAPIYTAFCVSGSTAHRHFCDRKIIESRLAPILKIWRLYSPLRFLIPAIWKGIDLSDYDLVITSASWYVARGFKIGAKTRVICYCHTPPRWLYGYQVSVGFTKYWPVRVYGAIVGYFIRLFDFETAQLPKKSKRVIRAGVDLFIANSKNVRDRIEKFYRRQSVVVYPPVDTAKIMNYVAKIKDSKRENYFLIVSRLVGAKGIEQAIEVFQSESLSGYKLKIVGESAGFSVISNISNIKSQVEFLGRVGDDELWELYARAKGFIALARDEDFGMTVVESQAAGTPVIAFNGGGFKESVIDLSAGVKAATGILIDDTDEQTISKAIKKLEKTAWDRRVLQANAMRFSKERFVRQIKNYASKYEIK